MQVARDQLPDARALESAVVRPQTYAHYQEADISLQAAVLAHGIAESQPFIEGNKRTALEATRVFLRLNGYRIAAPPLLYARWILELSADKTVDELAGQLRDHLESIF